MILHRIELHHVGPFRESVSVGPFTPGLNVLAAPNESGKTTALRAATRALFDRHTTRADEVKALQPAGTELAPRVAVEFETAAGRFRIEKTFLLAPRSVLQEWSGGGWQAVADGDRADARVQELLHGTLPGRGATKAEHWGFLGFLWARQGEPSDWPALPDEGVGRQIRHRLARIELDPVMERVAARLAAEAARSLTATGQAKVGGPLALTEEELRAIDAEMQRLAEQKSRAENLHLRHREAVTEVERLEREHAELEQKSAGLLEQSRAAERTLAEAGALGADLEARRAALAAIVTDGRLLEERQAALEEGRAALARAGESVRRLEAGLAESHAALAAAADAARGAETRRDALRETVRRLRALLDLRDARARSAALGKQCERAEETARERERIERQLAGLPALTPAWLSRLERLEEGVRTLRAQVQALGLTVELTPDADGSVSVDGREPPEVLTKGRTHSLHAPQALDLRLTGWGRVVVRSGSREAGELNRETATKEAAWLKALADAGVGSLEAAREALAARRWLEAELKAADAARADSLAGQESEAALRASWQESVRRAAALAESLGLGDGADASSRAEEESALAAAESDGSAAEAALKAATRATEDLRTREQAERQSLEKARQEAGELRARLARVEGQVADLLARHPTGLAQARDAAGQAFAEAEARVKAVRARLPPDHERLPERNRRAATSRQEVAHTLQARRSERDAARGSLEALGAQGLYSRETELLERRGGVEARRDAARLQSWAARLGQTLIEHRRQASTRSVLAPLEEQLSGAFAELTGRSDRKVFLDEDLGISGLGPNRASAHAFAGLSQGAREQLLLCLRVAVARELAREERQTLWLDDVLVNTDAGRQERVLDLLAALGGELQVIVLTCHPERYRGAGVPVVLAPGGAGQT